MRRGSSDSHAPPAPAEKEKLRRDRMKDLYSTLATLLHLHPYESKSLPAFLDQATASLKQLKESVEQLKVRKEELEKDVESTNYQQRLKFVQVTESMDLITLEVNLVFTVNNNRSSMVPGELLRVIEQGGAEIVSLNSHTVGQNIHCTIHAQPFHARLGFDAKQIEAQLKELVYQPGNN